MLGLAALVAGVVLFGWRHLRGKASSRLHLAGRILAGLLVAILVIGGGTYHLTKSRSFQFAGSLVQRVEADALVVALTFDDGPTRQYTEGILTERAAHDAKATFYLIGAACEENPQMLRSIIDAGHELGNHTYSHQRLYFKSEGTVSDEMERTDAVFRSARHTGPITFRMPGCKRLLTTPLHLARNERVTVLWDVEPDTVGASAGAKAFANYVIEHVRPGSIVLLHAMYESGQRTRDALPMILQQLSEVGYRFVTVSEMLGLG